MTSLLRRCALLVSAAALAGCAGLGTDEAADVGKQPAPAAATASPAPAGKPAPAAAAPGNPAEAKDKKPDGSRIIRGTGVLVKTPPQEQPSAEAANISLNFEAADVREIAKTVLADILQESYIVDPRVQGTISFRTTRPLPRSALMPTLETVLRMNGIVLVKENGIFKMMPASTVRGSLSPKMGGAFAGFTVQIVPLKFAGAREMAKILEPFAPDASAVKADEVRNLLILAGTQNEIRHLLDTVDMFDVDWLSGMSVGIFTLQSTDVKTLDAELSKIIGDKNLNPLAGMVRLIPIERLNAFIIITPQPHYLEEAKTWLERLDRAGGTGGTRLFVYHVQNGKAEQLAEMLNLVFGSGKQAARSTTPSLAPGLTGTTVSSTGTAGSTTTAGSTAAATTAQRTAAAPTGATLSVPGEGSVAGEVKIVADKENNALLILASAADHEKIESALKKLDIPPRQVLIEMTIAEVTLIDDLEYGVEWLFTNGPRRSGQLNINGSSSGLAVKIPGFSYAITSAVDGSIKSVLNMLASNNKINILSTPHIMVADNQTAKFQVGDSVPTSGPQTVSSAGVVVSSVQYLDTGIILSVTPRINASGMVNLDINQEVSTASSTTTSGLNSPTISKR